jgi:hypothetical protein
MDGLLRWLTSFWRCRPEQLAFERHRRLCTAIPFPPDLSWTTIENSEESLRKLHAYAVRLAHSAMDWYLRKRFWKMLWARTIHILVYAFGVFAAAVPLVKIFSPLEALITGSTGLRLDPNQAAELALVLVGLAGGISLIDRLLGLTSGWMRYMTAGMRLNDELANFHFDWSLWDMKAAASKPGAAVPPSNNEDANQTPPRAPEGCKCVCTVETDPTTGRIELVRKFCSRVNELVREETSGWADELTKHVSQLTQQLPTGPAHRGSSP